MFSFTFEIGILFKALFTREHFVSVKGGSTRRFVTCAVTDSRFTISVYYLRLKSGAFRLAPGCAEPKLVVGDCDFKAYFLVLPKES